MRRIFVVFPALLLAACSGQISSLFAPAPTETPTPEPTATPTPMPDFRELPVEEIIDIYDGELEFFSGNLGWIGASEDECLGIVIYTEQGASDGGVIEMALIVRDEEIDTNDLVCDSDGRSAFVETLLQTWTSDSAAMWGLTQLNDDNQVGQSGEAHGTRYVRERNYHIFAMNIEPIADMGG
jgi:hypothetical protein